jgi:rhodanese-related sulfurtransferase
MTKSGIVLLICTLLTPSLADLLPHKLPGVETVDAEALIDLAYRQQSLILIDARIESDRRHGYIEDSVSLPEHQTSCRSLARVSNDLTRPLAFYCNGVDCLRSVKAVQTAQQCGYTRLYWLRGGFEEWRAKQYPYLTG